MVTLNYCMLPTMNLCKPSYTSRIEIIHPVILFLPPVTYFFCSRIVLLLYCRILFRYCKILFWYCSVPVLQNYVLVTSCSITYLELTPKWYELFHVLNIVFTLGNWRYGLIFSCSFYQGSFKSCVELFFTLMYIFPLHFYTHP